MQLLYLAEVLGFQVQFTDFPKVRISRCIGALDKGRIGIFYAFKMPKTHWR
jgi:hypothetical protein